MHAPRFHNTTIIGVGLLGASVALALREKAVCNSIYGYGRTEQNLRQAKERGIIDGYHLDVRKASENADLIVLATPVGMFRGLAEDIRGSVKKGVLVTDVGSVKGGLVPELEALMPDGTHYIGSHPIAGSDRSGISDARADLFSNAQCIVTPTAASDKKAADIIVALWESLGCRVRLLDPFQHDEIYGTVSHLPHIAAYALVNTVDDVSAEYMEYAGQGFKDTTRIALSSPEMWRDISILNRENLIRLIGLFKGNLERLEALLKEADTAGIEKEFTKAQALRKKIK